MRSDGAPLILFGLPDQDAAVVRYALEIPKLSSLILKHSLDAPLAGLDTVPRENWPPVPITFWSFRVMVGLGFLMLGLGLFSLWLRWRGRLFESRPLHRFALAMGPAGFVAVLAGCSSPAERAAITPQNVVVAKPHPYSVAVRTAGGSETGALDSSSISDADLAVLDAWGTDIADRVRGAVSTVNDPRLRIADLADAFAGHRICDPEPYQWGRDGEIPFHPNAAGHAALAKRLSAVLDALVTEGALALR